MFDKLIGYLLNALEADETRTVEETLQTDPSVHHQLELLRTGLSPLQGSDQAVEAPSLLAVRTCQRIREAMALQLRDR